MLFTGEWAESSKTSRSQFCAAAGNSKCFRNVAIKEQYGIRMGTSAEVPTIQCDLKEPPQMFV